ncbi:hypothetical protein Tco_0792716 [Tanacetum coccineum]
MAFTQASSSNPSKNIKLTIIPPRKLFVDLTNEDYDTTTPSHITKSSSPSPPNAPSKTPSSTFGTTSSSFESKLQFSPLCSNDTPSPQPFNPFLDDILDAPPIPSNPIPLQSHPSLITCLNHPHLHHYHRHHHLHLNHQSWVIPSISMDEMHFMFSHIEYLLTSAIASPYPPHP